MDIWYDHQINDFIELMPIFIPSIEPALNPHMPQSCPDYTVPNLSDEIMLIISQMKACADNAINLLNQGKIYSAYNEVKLAKAMQLRSMILANPDLSIKQVQSLINKGES